jgi:hypothetical protein
MPVSAFTAGLIADQFIRDNDLQPTCKGDIVLRAKQLGEDPEANQLVLGEWLEVSPHARKARAVKLDEMIDIEMERKMYGPDATPQGRAAGYRHYAKLTGSDEFAEQRRIAWNADAGIIKSGKEPGGEDHDAATVKRAQQIVADEFDNCPYNPNRRFVSVETRNNEISRYIKRFGTKQAQKAANHFQVDLAARPLRQRA